MRATASIKLGLKKEEENAGKSLSEEKRLGPKWENGSCLVLGGRERTARTRVNGSSGAFYY